MSTQEFSQREDNCASRSFILVMMAGHSFRIALQTTANYNIENKNL
jgi:hypothetical protein